MARRAAALESRTPTRDNIPLQPPASFRARHGGMWWSFAARAALSSVLSGQAELQLLPGIS